MASQTTFAVSTESDLDTAVQSIDTGGADAAATTAYTIDITALIDLHSDLFEVNLQSGSSLTIAGTTGAGGVQVQTLDGGGSQGGLLISAGDVAVENLTIANAVVQGGTLDVGLGGTATGTIVLGAEMVLAGGSDGAATIGSGGVQQVYGSASGAVVRSGGVQIVEAGGTASGTVIQGGTLDLEQGGALAGSVIFAGGGTFEIDGASIPTATISGFGTGETIDLTGIPFDAAGSAVLTSGNVLQVTEGGETVNLNLDPAQSFAGHGFTLASDGHGGTSVADPVMPTLTNLFSFPGVGGFAPEGGSPLAGLIIDHGNLFGTTSGGGGFAGRFFGTVFELVSNGSSYTLTTLVTFTGTNGADPLAGLFADGSGNLFGTTAQGGANGDGTVFELVNGAGSYTLTTLVNFNGTNGQYPAAGLIADGSGNLLGTTELGGANGDGTVFEIAKTGGSYAGTPATLVSFNGTNGGDPTAGLIAVAGNLFGTTELGGANGDGTVFELAKTATGYASTPTTLVSFNGTNGQYPLAGLIADGSGNLFGTTGDGGANGTGTVFEIAKTGNGYAGTPTTLVSFNNTNGAYPFINTGGAHPAAGLVIDAAGNLFGTTAAGGPDNEGTVFELAKGGGGSYTLTALVNFSHIYNGGSNGGYIPVGGLISDGVGDLLGTTEYGGLVAGANTGDGMVFELSGTGFQVAVLFTSGADNVNFNSLTQEQQDAVNAGADLYHSLDGNDTVTLPDPANYQVTPTVAWDPTQTFVLGDGNIDKITGGDGDYYVHLGAGNDTVTLGNGNDTIYGYKIVSLPEALGVGNATIIAGNGNDTLTGGDGNYNVGLGSGTDTVMLGDGADMVTIVGGVGIVDTVSLGDGNDTVKLGNGKAFVMLGNGNDTVMLGDGSNDFVKLGNGKDFVAAGDGGDTITVGNGNDTITPGAGDDFITLGSETDTVYGSPGNDRIFGGDGQDTFDYVSPSGAFPNFARFGAGTTQTIVGLHATFATYPASQNVIKLPGEANDYTFKVTFTADTLTGTTTSIQTTTASGFPAITINTQDVEAVKFASPPTLESNYVALLGYKPGTVALTGYNPGANYLVAGDLATEMLQLAYDVYSQPYKFNGSLLSTEPLSTPEPLAYDTPASPDETANAVASEGWHPVSAMELGMAPADFGQGGLAYSFSNGLYQATVKGGTAEADAMVLLGVVDRQTTLSIVFRGTDQLADFGLYGNFAAYYQEFAPLVSAIEGYLANPANAIQQVIVSAHSLGAGALQYLVDELQGQRQQYPTVQVVRGYTDGSPGSENPTAGLPINNFVQIGDPVTLVPSIVGTQGQVKSLLLALTGAGAIFGGPSEAAFIYKSLSNAQPKTRVGSDIYIDANKNGEINIAYHDGLLYAENVETLYQFANDANSPFAYSQIGQSLSNDTLYTPNLVSLNPYAPGAVDGSEIAVNALVSLNNPVPGTFVYVHPSDNYVLGGNFFHIFWDLPTSGELVHVVDGGPSGNAIVVLLGPSTDYDLVLGANAIGPFFQVYYVPDEIAGNPSAGLIGDVYRVPLSHFLFTGGYVNDVSAFGDGAPGHSIQLTLAMSGPITVNTSGGLPKLTLGDPVTATYDAAASNPAAGTLVFDYTPGPGDQFANLRVDSVNLNGAVITGVGGAAVDFSAATNVQTGLSINSPLTVTSLASSQTGEIGAGQTVQLTLTMSEAFTVSAIDLEALSLALNDGDIATYDTTASSPVTGLMVFDYTVQAGDQTGNLAISAANVPGGVTVRDDNGFNANFSSALGVGTGLQIGSTANLTTGPDTFVEPAGSSDNTVIASANTLSTGDDIDPGNGGGNTLVLKGTGIFNMTLPATLADIGTVTAHEGQASYVHNGATYASQTQIVDLRGGLDATVDVAPATTNPGNPNAPTITIVGAANDASTINLATGNNAVTLGSAQETVNGGGGNNTFYVNAATIGATINGGSGANLLEVTGGGTMAMGANIKQIADALMIGSSTPYDFTANSLSGLLVDDLGTGTTDTLAAGGSNQTLTGGGAGKLTMDAANQSGDLFKDSAATFSGDTVKDLVNSDMIDVTGLAFSAPNTSLGFAFNSGPDTTTMSVLLSGTQKTAITLLGQYMAADFSVSADTAGTGTLVTLNHELNLSAPH